MNDKLTTIDLLDVVKKAFETCQVTYEYPDFIQVIIDERTYITFNDQNAENNYQFSWTCYIDDSDEYYGDIDRVYETPEQIANEFFAQVWEALVK